MTGTHAGRCTPLGVFRVSETAKKMRTDLTIFKERKMGDGDLTEATGSNTLSRKVNPSLLIGSRSTERAVRCGACTVCFSEEAH